MKKLLLFAFTLFFAGSMMAQNAITIEPENATAWDEITLYLDVSKTCPDSALFGVDSVMMHSGVTINDTAWSKAVSFDGMGVNGQMPKLTKVEPMAYAVTMVPADATAWDEVTLTLDANMSCPEGALLMADTVMMHSGVTIDDTLAWSNVIEYNGVGADGTTPQLTSNGDGTWSITYTPAAFYGLEEGANVTAINCVFNNGSWDAEGKAFDEEGACTDFMIPFGGGTVREESYVWMITFTPADFYGIEEGADVTAINCVFNNGTWDAEGKDFDADGNCTDFLLALSGVGIFEQPNAVTFNVFPNPANTVLNVNNIENANKVKIFNVVGAVVKSMDVASQNITVDVSDLNKGIYFVSVYNKTGVQTTKFVKE